MAPGCRALVGLVGLLYVCPASTSGFHEVAPVEVDGHGGTMGLPRKRSLIRRAEEEAQMLQPFEKEVSGNALSMIDEDKIAVLSTVAATRTKAGEKVAEALDMVEGADEEAADAGQERGEETALDDAAQEAAVVLSRADDNDEQTIVALTSELNEELVAFTDGVASNRPLAKWLRDIKSALSNEKVLRAAKKGSQPSCQPSSVAPLCWSEVKYGIGDRLRRLLMMAAYAWSVGRDLQFDWGKCGNQTTFGSMFDPSRELAVPGLGCLLPWTLAASQPILKAHGACPNEVVYKIASTTDDDHDDAIIGEDRWPCEDNCEEVVKLDGLADANQPMAFLRPEVAGSIAAFQDALRPEWGEMAERMFHNAQRGGYKVVGVHLRLGNGEEDFLKDGREIRLSDEDISSSLEHEAQRLATERGWGTKYRILLATDTPRIAAAWTKRSPQLVVTRQDGCFMSDNGGIVMPGEHPRDEGPDIMSNSSCLLGATWADATALGFTDLLMTPVWSELMLVPKTMALTGGGEWCVDGSRYREGKPFNFGRNFSCVSLRGLMQGTGFAGADVSLLSDPEYASMPHLKAFSEERLAALGRRLSAQ